MGRADTSASGDSDEHVTDHPRDRPRAEVVLATLLRGRAVDLPDWHAYFLDTGLTLGHVAAEGQLQRA